MANGNPAQEERYGYDPLNNRIRKTVGGATTVTAYVHDPANQLTEIRNGVGGPLLATLQYDANGNLIADGTRSYTWDALNQLAEVTSGATTVSYRYDGQGRRIKKTLAGTTTLWLYDGANIYAEYGSTWSTPNAVYTFGSGTDEPLIRAATTGANTYGTASYYYADGLGSIVGLSNNLDASVQTQRFDAWGNKLSGTVPPGMQYGYTGRPQA